MSQEKDEVRRLLEVLHTLLRMLAVSNREVERRLGLQHGTISRLLNGTIEAKLEVVLGVARALGLEYEELFAFLYPSRPAPKPESDAARRIRSMLEDLMPHGGGSVAATVAAKSPVDYQEIKKAIREVLQEEGTATGGGPKAGNGGEP
ncbi:MAG TPA: helix-turn-helix transcriptional regulator [Thermoanaerobaculia bacterium]|nr:helix-turn-helix transcriptional regulator [Thermoanaerobaculia bacterium]